MRGGDLLHARGEMHRLPRCAIMQGHVAGHRTHDDLARADADADVDFTQQFILNAGPHRQCGAAGLGGMLLDRHRRAEQRHDAITEDLVDDAVMRPDRRPHLAQHVAQHVAGVLRIAIRDQVDGALDVREQDSDDLALAAHHGSALGRADPRAAGRAEHSAVRENARAGCTAQHPSAPRHHRDRSPGQCQPLSFDKATI